MQIWLVSLRRLAVAVVTAGVLMAFPQPVRAVEEHVVSVFFYEFDREGEAFFTTEQFYVCGGLDGDILLWVRFANLLENHDVGKVPCVMPGTRLLGIWRDAEMLYLNLSREVLGYGGGAGNERLLLEQLFRNAQDVEGVVWLTVLVEGETVVWPEGSHTRKIPILQMSLY